MRPGLWEETNGKLGRPLLTAPASVAATGVSATAAAGNVPTTTAGAAGTTRCALAGGTVVRLRRAVAGRRRALRFAIRRSAIAGFRPAGSIATAGSLANHGRCHSVTRRVPAWTIVARPRRRGAKAVGTLPGRFAETPPTTGRTRAHTLAPIGSTSRSACLTGASGSRDGRPASLARERHPCHARRILMGKERL